MALLKLAALGTLGYVGYKYYEKNFANRSSAPAFAGGQPASDPNAVRDAGPEAMRDALMKLADMAFGEDKVMIEAQQKVIDRTPDPRVMPTAHDKGVTMFNRLVERMARAEAEGNRDAA